MLVITGCMQAIHHFRVLALNGVISSNFFGAVPGGGSG